MARPDRPPRFHVTIEQPTSDDARGRVIVEADGIVLDICRELGNGPGGLSIETYCYEPGRRTLATVATFPSGAVVAVRDGGPRAQTGGGPSKPNSYGPALVARSGR